MRSLWRAEMARAGYTVHYTAVAARVEDPGAEMTPKPTELTRWQCIVKRSNGGPPVVVGEGSSPAGAEDDARRHADGRRGPLGLDVAECAEAAVVTLTGNLDADTVGESWLHVRPLLPGRRHVIVDLSRADLLDPAGLAALVSLRDRLRGDGRRVGLLCGGWDETIGREGLESGFVCEKEELERLLERIAPPPAAGRTRRVGARDGAVPGRRIPRSATARDSMDPGRQRKPNGGTRWPSYVSTPSANSPAFAPTWTG